ncbi:DUF427 domain-containing protein [Tychonema sp. BBK16]|uniref:DUF427 domain-containing protein n=1 Tax=Tychonema sp. BBK16 TaxID=2699888 RepID=UPI001F3D0272|nr:DUF427 domain-containing protein [Tychonema sp. BBK16]
MNSDRIEPGVGQESVWDYPRPPRLEVSTKHVEIIFNGVKLANTHRAFRVLETSHPPSYYISPDDIQMQYLHTTLHGSWCEWKGQASYCTVTVGDKQAVNVGWFYTNPNQVFEAIKDYVAFYPSRMDACYVDGELVQAQPGDFYGGWITEDIIGPFKGGMGTWGW